MATKTFVLSAGAVLSSDSSLLRFGSDNNIVIPLCILDKIRAYRGKYEKECIATKILDYVGSLPEAKYDINKGVIQSNGSKLMLVRNFKDIKLDELEGLESYESRILQTCIGLEKSGFQNVVLISKNAVLRIKAELMNIKAENFRDELFPSIKEQYTGRRIVEVQSDIINTMYKEKKIPIEQIIENPEELIANEFLLLKCGNNKYLSRYDVTRKEAVSLLIQDSESLCGPAAKSDGQSFMLEALFQSADVAPLVIIKGTAGTGKTYCTLGMALAKQEANEYNRILVTTPNETIGGERIGFLPGDINDKVSPYLGGIYSNLEVLLNYSENSIRKRNSKEKDQKEQYESGEYYFEKGIIKIQPIGFLRGQSIVNTFFIIDETQNIDPSDIKSILTRAAKGSKFVFLGDPTQIDNPKLNERYNGLVYLSESMKGDPLCWQITLGGDNESVRGPLALSAVQRLCK